MTIGLEASLMAKCTASLIKCSMKVRCIKSLHEGFKWIHNRWAGGSPSAYFTSETTDSISIKWSWGGRNCISYRSNI